MFEALVNDPSKVTVPVQEVYDTELPSSLPELSPELPNSATLEEASRLMNEGNLPTILDRSGTLQPIRSMDVASITHWFVLERAQTAFQCFERGLTAPGKA